MSGVIAGLPEYVAVGLIAGSLLVVGAVLYIVGRAVLGRNAEPAKRLASLLRAARGK